MERESERERVTSREKGEREREREGERRRKTERRKGEREIE